jgi:hypothetical protein
LRMMTSGPTVLANLEFAVARRFFMAVTRRKFMGTSLGAGAETPPRF